MITEIASKSNKTYKYLKSLLMKKCRAAEGVFTVEGEKSVHDALAAGCVKSVAASESFYQSKSFDYGDCDVFVVSDALFPQLCDTKTPQGILAVCGVKEGRPEDIAHGRYVYCDSVSDPGNLGTIIRTADAAGFDGVLLSEGCADLYSPKTVRASMGSFFHVRLMSGLNVSQLKSLADNEFKIVCGVLHHDSVDYREADLSGNLIIVIGNEANGVSEEAFELCGERITIPMMGGAESLNAAVAAALLMYEALRRE